jgi:O-glycosyl hydrolase
MYTAPSAAGTCHVVATSHADPTKSDVATVSVALPPPPGNATFTASWNETHQTIDGFGASTAFAVPFSNSVADFLWSPSLGIGLSLVRDEITPNGWPTSMTVMNSTGVSKDGDFSVLQQAVSRGARAWGTIWAFPSSWTGGKANGPLDTSHYADAANLLVTYVDRAWSAGIPIYAVSVMNEPDLVPSYPQTAWTPSQALAFVKSNATPAMNAWATSHSGWTTATGLPAPLVTLPETAKWASLASWINAVEADPTGMAEIGHYTTHQYFGGSVSAPPALVSHPIWETETFKQSVPYDATIADALDVAKLMYDALTTGNASAWHYWFAEDVSDPDNSGLIGTDAHSWTNATQSVADWNSPPLPKRAFAVGNYAKFVRPGWIRIGVQGALNGVSVTAYKDAGTGDFAIVVINATSANVTTSFAVSGASFSTVTPYVTSGTALGAIGTDGNLSAGSPSAGIPASVAASGNAFTVTVPRGLTTLVGTAH